MSETEQIMESIINELQEPSPSKKKILAYLFKNRSFPYTEIIEIVEEIFRLHPEAYMEHIYKVVRKKIRKLYGHETLKEMEKTIIERHCLQDEEQILLEFDGMVQLFENPKMKSRGAAVSGTVYVTNNRIIAQGAIVAMAGSFSSGYPARKRIITQSRQNRIYGYIFPIKSLSQLSRNLVNKGVNYNVEGHGVSHKFQNIRIIMGRTANREETTLHLIEILSNHT